MAEGGAVAEGWAYDEVAELRSRVWKDGLRTPFRGRPLAEAGQRLLAIAEGGLLRRGRIDRTSGKDERVHLARLRKLVESGRTPADALLDGMASEKDPARAMIERSALTWK